MHEPSDAHIEFSADVDSIPSNDLVSLSHTAQSTESIQPDNSASTPFRPASDYVVIELCAGSAKLSHTLRSRGFQVIPIDHSFNRHTSCVKCLDIDLTRSDAYDILCRIFASCNVIYIHMAPPCGTSTRAREKRIPQWLLDLGAPNPKPLRSDEYPLGLPGLSDLDQKKVDAANAIYEVCYRVLLLAKEKGILISCENPSRSYLWSIPPWSQLTSDPHFEPVDFQNCMFGGSRDKWSRWLCTRGHFSHLALECDRNHTHLPWGFNPGGSWSFATADEAEYQLQLCEAVADVVEQHARSMNIAMPPKSMQQQLQPGQQLFSLRAAAGKLPRGMSLPPLLSEFKETFESKIELDDKSLKLLRQGARRGEDGSQHNYFIYGRFRTPGEYIAEAVTVKHPFDTITGLSDITKTALYNVLSLGPVGISKKRLLTLQKIRNWKNELESDEKSLHDSMPFHLKRVLEGKNLLLLKKLISISGFPDTSLADDIAAGFDMIGDGRISNALNRKIVPATVTEQELKTRSETARKLVAETCVSSGDCEIDEELYRITIEERDAGWLSGPFTENEMDQMFDQWLPNRRFGIRQGEKIRQIDDASLLGQNDCFTSVEKLQLMDVDNVAVMIKEAIICSNMRNNLAIKISNGNSLTGTVHPDWFGDKGHVQWLGRCLDLKSAYKQLGYSEKDKWCTPIMVYNPAKGQREYFCTHSLMFGATSSVYNFNRLGRALWHIATVMLDLIQAQFYDDFPCIEPDLSAKLAQSSFQSLLKILGLPFSEGKKCLPFSHEFNALGVTFSLPTDGSKAFYIKNKKDRVESIAKQIDDVLASNDMGYTLAAEMHGKLRYTEAQIFGRGSLPYIRELSARASNKLSIRKLGHKLEFALRMLKQILLHGPARKIDTADNRRPILVFTDGSHDEQRSGWGLVFMDLEYNKTFVTGSVVPHELRERWLSEVGSQIIGQVELLPVLLCKSYFHEVMTHRKVVFFIDNESARMGLIKATSSSSCSDKIIRLYYELERSFPSVTWFARVPSFSNPADVPSRGEFSKLAEALGGECLDPDVVLTEALTNAILKN
jgi:hypothetical protein